jgi:hypothetical protein
MASAQPDEAINTELGELFHEKPGPIRLARGRHGDRHLGGRAGNAGLNPPPHMAARQFPFATGARSVGIGNDCPVGESEDPAEVTTLLVA